MDTLATLQKDVFLFENMGDEQFPINDQVRELEMKIEGC